MNQLNSFSDYDLNALKFNDITDVQEDLILSFKEDLLLKILRKYLNREPTNEDLLKVTIEYSLNSQELIYDNASLGKFEISFENNKEDFLRNNFRVVCNFKPYASMPSTFPIVTT